MILLLPAPVPKPDAGWINASVRPPEKGWIVKRWKTGAVWAGKYDGTDKMGSCDEWMPLPKPRGHANKDGIVTFTPKQG